MLETFFNIITRKLEVNDELTFTSEFFESLPDETSLVSQFFLMQSKIYLTSITWLIEKQEPKPLSKLFPKDPQQVKPPKIDFFKPKSFTREFSIKSYLTGISCQERLDLIDLIYFECFQTISIRIYLAGFFQKSLNNVIEQKARVNRMRLGDGDQDLIIQI